MGHIICSHKGRYNVYSTVVDTFLFDKSMSLEELQEYTKEEFGLSGLRELSVRVKRADEKGTSCIFNTSLADAIASNVCGSDNDDDGDPNWSVDRCIHKFLS